MITVTLPIPAKLLPNAARRMHWAARGKIAKQCRRDAGYVAVAAMEGGRNSPPRWTAATVSVRVVKRDARNHADNDNLIASLKAYIDGCVDAGILADDKGLRWGNVEWVVDRTITKQQERVELMFDAFPAG